MLRAIIFFSLIASAIASAALDVLVSAAASFSAAIRQQFEMLHNVPSPPKIAAKTINYAEAKKAYFKALQAETPELKKNMTGTEERSPELDTFAAALAIASDDQEKEVDQATLVLLKRYTNSPEIEKAMAEFEQAQKAEESFQKSYDELNLN
jgi:hypothetical protein